MNLYNPLGIRYFNLRVVKYNHHDREGFICLKGKPKGHVEYIIGHKIVLGV